jgi:hypothetical protein
VDPKFKELPSVLDRMMTTKWRENSNRRIGHLTLLVHDVVIVVVE